MVRFHVLPFISFISQVADFASTSNLGRCVSAERDASGVHLKNVECRRADQLAIRIAS